MCIVVCQKWYKKINHTEIKYISGKDDFYSLHLNYDHADKFAINVGLEKKSNGDPYHVYVTPNIYRILKKIYKATGKTGCVYCNKNIPSRARVIPTYDLEVKNNVEI